jgi:hypothetical protein
MMIIAMKFVKAYALGNQKHKKIQLSIQLKVKAFGSHLSIRTNIIVQIMQSNFMNQGFKT